MSREKGHQGLAMKKLLRAKDIVEMYGFKQTTAYKILNTKGVPIMRIGGIIVVKQEDFEEWLEKQKVC